MMASTLYGESGLPPELDARVRRELNQGERLLWTGQPLPRRMARATIPIVIFGIPFTAFAFFWIAAASGLLFGGFGGGGPPGIGWFAACFPLFGIPFVFVGLGMLTAPFWVTRQAKKTCYALTDQRAILWRAGWWGSIEVRSYGPANLSRLTRTEYDDGSGDLVFEEFVTYGHSSKGHRTSNVTRYGFIAIPNVREVEELLRKTLIKEENR